MLGEAAGGEGLIEFSWLLKVLLFEVRAAVLVSFGICCAEFGRSSYLMLLLRCHQVLELPHCHFSDVWDVDVSDGFDMILRNNQGHALADAHARYALNSM